MAQKLGVGEASARRQYVSMRIGSLCLTSKEPMEGYEPAKTVNKSGTEYHFFAKRLPFLTGYIEDINLNQTEFDGKTLTSWNLVLDVGRDEEWVISIKEGERPFTRLMSTLCNIDFRQPVKFVGFTGRDKNKVLLLYQDDVDEVTGKEKPVQAKYPERWMSTELADKIKSGVELSERDEWNVARDEKGNIDSTYPYITQSAVTGKWSFDRWNDFLFQKMQEDVIPACQRAAEARANVPADNAIEGEVIEDDDIPF